MIGKVREWLPRGNTLDSETFHKRHLFICWVLGVHLPALFVFGVVQGFGVGTSLIEMITPAACLVLARVVHNRRFAAFFATAGLVFCSSVLVHFSGGMIEAHFHFFVLIGIIALYQDWVPFAWNAVFTTLSHGLGSGLAADSMFNHHAGQNSPWVWATIHGVAVLAGCVGVVVFWKSTENVQIRNNRLLAELGANEVAAAQNESRQRQTMSDLLVNLARRNQSLLNRQLALIAELEQRERQPEALSDLFQLDHLATRIRRNAESLLVLSGDDPPRLWGRPMPLSEVVRAAAAEVEDYGRVDVLVNDHIEVAGRAVADLAHLLAELIENATTFSPPGSAVRVRSHVAPTDWSSYMVSIEDTGIGMSDDDLEAANQMLIEPREVDMRRSTLGFHVVSRLAKRYGIDVRVASTPGGGLTALVTLPDDMVAERISSAPSPALTPVGATGPMPPPAALGAGAVPPPAALPAAPFVPAAPAPTPLAPAAQAAPAAVGPLPRRPRPPVAPLAASLSTPPVAPAPAVRTEPGTLTSADVGALAAFRSPTPPPPPSPPLPPVSADGLPPVTDPTVPPPPGSPVPSAERPPGAIWPSSLSSSDALPVATPPSSLAPMAPPEPLPPPPPSASPADPPPPPGVTPTPPLLARGGNLFERSQPTPPTSRARRPDPYGAPDPDDTPVPSLTRPYVPPPRVLPADADDDFLLLGIAPAAAPAPGGDGQDAGDAAADAATADARTDEAPAGTGPGDDVEVEPDAGAAADEAAVAGSDEVEPEAEDEPLVAVAEPDPESGDTDPEVGLEARVGDVNGRDDREGSRDALDTGTMAIIQGLDDVEADADSETAEPLATVAAAATENGTTATVDAPVDGDGDADAAAAADDGADAPEVGDPAPVPALTADGLVRRVPGAGLAPALRRDPTKTVPGDTRDGDQRPADGLDRQVARSMLSQFQASQRAGRAIADSPVDLRPPEEDT